MAAVNASRNRFIVCRQCLKIRGDTTRRMRVILGPSIRGFLSFARALSAREQKKLKTKNAFSSKSSSFSVTRKSSPSGVSHLTPTFFADSTNRKTRLSSPFNYHYRSSRYARETHFAANRTVTEWKDRFFVLVFHLLRLSKKIGRWINDSCEVRR